ncbi:hypothetical protein LB505_004392 [Fusarium chuoi]|nr:hypothetical protein LB505_004392 [Fusarium chuoi]
MMQRRVEGKRRSLLSLLTRKRKRKEPEEIPRDPVRLNFLFVGSKAAGQTSLLFQMPFLVLCLRPTSTNESTTTNLCAWNCRTPLAYQT